MRRNEMLFEIWTNCLYEIEISSLFSFIAISSLVRGKGENVSPNSDYNFEAR